ncbi:hypothetical protein [Winogradskyella alexanderae]|uniref:DUF1129 family protein n=1 Tax=Winogradskyella alexanderae TaxID=2877123 RepID=A0ABS7XQJ9_9FLAO|nr:hypothetical protein [Winogradskyella alexanderae]MCA0131316.1 hypothetical protein [Winogradskyella alexanderae]
MKLTKEEVQFIDKYLKEGGIKYWDIRLEMVDHLVSDIESYEGSADFKTLFLQSLKNANWAKNLNEVNTNSWKSTNKIYRSKHTKELLSILKNPIYIIGILGFYSGFTWVTNLFPLILRPLSFAVLLAPMIVMVYELIRSWRMKLGHSINMNYGFFYFSFGIIMMNLPIQFLPKEYLNIWLPIVMTVYLILAIAGYRVYKFAFKEVLKMKN